MSAKPTAINRELDGITISVYLALLLIGWLMIAATNTTFIENENFSIYNLLLSKETLWFGVAIASFFACLIIDAKVWNSFAWIIYGLGILFLIGVLLFGADIKGARSWYNFLGYSFQPSEFAKLATSLGVAAFLSLSITAANDLRNTATFFGIVMLPVFFILLQPDAGSAMTFLSFFIVFYRAGAPSIYYLIAFFMFFVLILSLMFNPLYVILGMSVLAIAALSMSYKNPILLLSFSALLGLFAVVFMINGYVLVPVLVIMTSLIGLIFYTGFRKKWNNVLFIGLLLIFGSGLSVSSSWAYNNVLKPHQQDRINVWLNPEKCDPQGSLYNVNQSKVAIGSGGVYGKGFLKGDMTKLNYVPEQSTDFIVSTLGEEQGFIGVLGVLILFSILLIRIIIIAERASSTFVTYFAYCIFGFLFLQTFINIGMSMGFMPVIGIPLPFISKGGSSLVVVSLMIGILVKLDMVRRRV